MLTQETLKEFFNYDQNTGIFSRTYSKRKCGRIDKKGFLILEIMGKDYRAHHLAWFYFYGVFPVRLWHINGNKVDNNIYNLTDKRPQKISQEITQEILKSFLYYDEKTGIFTRIRSIGGEPSGSIANHRNTMGYIAIRIMNKSYLAHRLAWLYVHGELPKCEIDHKDTNRDNNSISNLRKATRPLNAQNEIRARSNNKSGLLGVSKESRSGKYLATIRSHGKTKYIGMFGSPEEAHQAYLTAKRKLHEFCTI